MCSYLASVQASLHATFPCRGINGPLKLMFTNQAYLFPSETSPSSNALGLGDMVLPGLLLALILRYDKVHNEGKTSFFVSTMVGYVTGVATCMVFMISFNTAQPALLYIVPGVLGALAAHAAAVGKLFEVFKFTETSDEDIQKERQKSGKEADTTGKVEGKAE